MLLLMPGPKEYGAYILLYIFCVNLQLDLCRMWTWQGGASVPPDSNLGVAFSGWADPSLALSDSNNVYSRLPGRKYISLGGGNGNGRFTWSNLNSIQQFINNNAFSAYAGLVFDIEEGDSGLVDAFNACFQACKNKGLYVLVTVSHSAPYGISDAASLMRSFLQNSNIDFISPQLYSSGYENSNDYSITYGVQWYEYASAKAEIIPSVCKYTYYDDAYNYFRSQGVTLTGYVQWQN
jgi:hypothetical protein